MQPTDLIPEAWREPAARMAAALRTLDRVIIAGHVNPDGDALGSVAALGCLLRSLGKECVLYSKSGVPPYLTFLPLPGSMHDNLQRLPFRPAAAVLLDCGEPHRLGDELEKALPSLTSVNIDHHLGSEGMGSLANWIEPQAAATAQLTAYVAISAGLTLDGMLGQALALGLVTDTGGFAHGNTSAAVLHLAAHLVERGCDIALLRQQLENGWSMGRMRLWARLMERIQLLANGTLAFCAVRLDDLQSCGATKEDLEGFVEQMRRLAGVRAAALLREDAPGSHKFSLRSFGETDVRAVAAALGGGGHRNAAGGTLRMDAAQAAETLAGAVSAIL